MKNTGALKVAAAGDREIVFTRVFEAPRSRVFDALTRPDLLKRWHGPHGWSLVVCEVDLKAGGAFRFVWRRGTDATSDMGMGGVYREVVPPERLVHAERFDVPWYPGECVITTVLVEESGKTTFTATLRYESREARDAVLSTPMEHGVAEAYDKLAELLK
jgi:uncharacterized protein YndB with AHSA1/START domain